MINYFTEDYLLHELLPKEEEMFSAEIIIMEKYAISSIWVLGVLGIILYSFWLSYLRRNFPHVWEKAGSPSLFFNNSLQNTFRMTHYFWKKEYLQEKDETLHQLARVMLFYEVFYLFYFFGWMAYLMPWRKLFMFY